VDGVEVALYPLYCGGGGGWIVRYITQSNYKWFIFHNANFILTPPVYWTVLKTAIITYSVRSTVFVKILHVLLF